MTSSPTLPADASSLHHAGRQWPVVEGIPFVRAGREELADAALASISAGDERAALVMLLADRDDWATGPPPTTDDIEDVVHAVDGGATLRDAMRGLRFGPVADYFTYRWSDPTFLSGMALLRAAWPTTQPRVVELACGIGQLLAVADDAGATVTGVDVVFSKLWLARRFVVPTARLVCADVSSEPLPLGDAAADLVFIHDALYFMSDKQHVLAEAQRIGGSVAVGHAHNALVDNLSAGHPLSPTDWMALLPGSRCFDDLELTASWLEYRPARPCRAPDLVSAAAMAMVAGDGVVTPDHLGRSRPGRPLHLNPLHIAGATDPVSLCVRWPTARYREEYASLSGYLHLPEVSAAVLERALAGHADDPEVAALLRRRILLDLPERW